METKPEDAPPETGIATAVHKLGPTPGASLGEPASTGATISDERAFKAQTVVGWLDAALQAEGQVIRTGRETEQINKHTLESIQFVGDLASSVASSNLSNISNLTMLERKVKGRYQTDLEF